MATLTRVVHNQLSVTIIAETIPISWVVKLISDEMNIAHIHPTRCSMRFKGKNWTMTLTNSYLVRSRLSWLNGYNQICLYIFHSSNQITTNMYHINHSSTDYLKAYIGNYC